jgi:hypothetical protein
MRKILSNGNKMLDGRAGFLRFPGVGMMVRGHKKTHPVRGGAGGVNQLTFMIDGL